MVGGWQKVGKKFLKCFYCALVVYTLEVLGYFVLKSFTHKTDEIYMLYSLFIVYLVGTL